VITAAQGCLRSRLDGAYTSQHPGHAGGPAIAPVYGRDVRSLLPRPSLGPDLDVGCGQGELVRLLQAGGYDAEGIDVRPEQAALAQTAGVCAVHRGDFDAALAARPGELGLVTATEVLDHYGNDEILATFDSLALTLITQNLTFAARMVVQS
jgi:2-polyprenyl-3-methyl-5-hydroxy-6-metoxy-1,4-benzoquinol methylase